ncbi:MAG: T9SS type A sorting domain-containing protein [Flavobacteriales bacterium]|jgi:hypothetical protein|nr:T9SS type A sorting domain-containing protein [Flavobacteriales bacterium]
METMLSRYAISLLTLLPCAVFAQTESEPNNSTATANALTMGTPMAGVWCSGEAADVFSFTTTVDGYLDIVFDVSHNSPQLNVYVDVHLLDASGQEVDGGPAYSGTDNVFNPVPFKFYCVSAGSYYLNIDGPASNECNDYVLHVALVQPVFGNDMEPNNNSAQAQLVPENTFIEGHENYSYGDDNADWFRIVTTADGLMTLDLDAYNQNAGYYNSTCELYDSALNNISTFTYYIGGLFEPDTSFNTFTRTCLGDGTYYLRVASNTMCGLSYRLRWSLAPAALTEDPADNDVIAYATPAYNAIEQQGHLNFDVGDDNSDWFVFDVLAEGPVQLNAAATFMTSGNANINVAWFDDQGAPLGSASGYMDGNDTFTPFTVQMGTFAPSTYYLQWTSPSLCGLSYRFTLSGIGQVGVAELQALDHVALFPNPAHDRLDICFDATKIVDLGFDVIDLNGRTVHGSERVQSSGTTTRTIDLSNFAIGSYFLRVTGAERTTCFPFQKY